MARTNHSTEEQDQEAFSEAGADPFLIIAPSELLRAIVKASDWGLRAYTLLIGLSHRTRTSLLGTLHEMSFVDPDVADADEYQAPTPTADALAALVGPCKDLEKLSFPNEHAITPTCNLGEATSPLFGCGVSEAVYSSWVDEAFAGHVRFATLRIPLEPFTPALARILGHLPGLVELHVMHPPGQPAKFKSSDSVLLHGLLAALRGSLPPALRVLQVDSPMDGQAMDQLLTGLAPTLEQLHLPLCNPGDVNALPKLLGRLPALSQLTLACDTPINLLPAACARLTRLTLDKVLGRTTVGMPVGRLESLDVRHRFEAPDALPWLLAANSATLRHLALSDLAGGFHPVPHHLTSLTLSLGRTSAESFLEDIPPGLLDQLEHLALSCEPRTYLKSLCIASRTLRTLGLHTDVLCYREACVRLACPALVTIADLPRNLGSDEYTVILDCPRLRTVRGLPALVTLQLSTVMPELVQVAAMPTVDSRDPNTAHVWLPQLMAAAPQLCEALLGDTCLSAPGALASSSLTRLTVALAPDSLPTDAALNEMRLLLPTQLAHADILLAERRGCRPAASRLRVVAAGLRGFRLRGSGASDVTLACPALRSLVLALDYLHSFEASEGSLLLLRSLEVDRCATTGASLLAVLAASHSTMRRVVLRLISSELAVHWPQILDVLQKLPALSSLVLAGDPPFTTPLSLACPVLRHLCLTQFHVTSLVLNCPLLEELWATFRAIRRFALSGFYPPPGIMRHIGGVSCASGAKRMGRLYPGAVCDMAQ
ncbi:hypothetical protein PAPYR_10465 [Paratrimastix pyriformis]|uniref:Uncharacterized protein n=1 Tax=Paratrimastix pyriformis TaxID=342808 RepID=A0ABQ8U5W7_9EUKA|nr:hypothetical protein PAPYR_10465 [Paratrimastix pyriformis]